LVAFSEAAAAAVVARVWTLIRTVALSGTNFTSDEADPEIMGDGSRRYSPAGAGAWAASGAAQREIAVRTGTTRFSIAAPGVLVVSSSSPWVRHLHGRDCAVMCDRWLK